MDKKKIEVRFSYEELCAMNFSYQVYPYVINKLRIAGIPVQGLLIFNGVSRGTLTQIDDIENMEYVFIWRE